MQTMCSTPQLREWPQLEPLAVSQKETWHWPLGFWSWGYRGAEACYPPSEKAAYEGVQAALEVAGTETLLATHLPVLGWMFKERVPPTPLAKATLLVNRRGAANAAGPAQSHLLRSAEGDKVHVVHRKDVLGKRVWVIQTSGKGKPINGIAFAQGPECTDMLDSKVRGILPSAKSSYPASSSAGCWDTASWFFLSRQYQLPTLTSEFPAIVAGFRIVLGIKLILYYFFPWVVVPSLK